MSGHLVKRFAAFRDCFLVFCVGVEGPEGCLTIRNHEDVRVVMFWYMNDEWWIAMTSATSGLEWDFYDDFGRENFPPVWELSLEPSVYMLMAFSN